MGSRCSEKTTERRPKTGCECSGWKDGKKMAASTKVWAGWTGLDWTVRAAQGSSIEGWRVQVVEATQGTSGGYGGQTCATPSADGTLYPVPRRR